jgi:hypothetical protein
MDLIIGVLTGSVIVLVLIELYLTFRLVAIEERVAALESGRSHTPIS